VQAATDAAGRTVADATAADAVDGAAGALLGR
jgi:hypothetical protein